MANNQETATAITAPSKSVTTQKNGVVSDAIAFAKNCGESALIPTAYRGKTADIIAAVIWGRSLGLEPLQALAGIAVINGKSCVYGDALLAIARGRSDCKSVKETFEDTTQTATCSVTRGSEIVTRAFSKKDAELARLWGKAGPWSQYPRRMLQMRARSWAIRDAYADALMGIYSAEEAMDISVETMPTTATIEAKIVEVTDIKPASAVASASVVTPTPANNAPIKPTTPKAPISEVANATIESIAEAVKQLGLDYEIKGGFIAARGDGVFQKQGALKKLGFTFKPDTQVWYRKAKAA